MWTIIRKVFSMFNKENLDFQTFFRKVTLILDFIGCTTALCDCDPRPRECRSREDYYAAGELKS